MPKPARPIAMTRRTSSRISQTSSTRRSSLSSTDSRVSTSLRRHKSSMSTVLHTPLPRRRRDSESIVYRLRKENHDPLAPVRALNEKHKSLDDSSLQRGSIKVASRTTPPAGLGKSSLSPLRSRCRRPFATPKRPSLLRQSKPMRKLSPEEDEGDWIDEEHEFAGGLG